MVAYASFKWYGAKKMTGNKPVGAKLTEREALDLAEKSTCSKEGTLANTAEFDKTRSIWVIKIYPKVKYGAPTCILNELTNQANPNYGLISPK